MPAASKNKLPPTLFMTAEINIKWKVGVYKITDPFQGFFTLFLGYCCGTTNCLFLTIGTNWHPGWQSRGQAHKRSLNEHGAWTGLLLEVNSTEWTKTHSWRMWRNPHCNYFCSLSKKKIRSISRPFYFYNLNRPQINTHTQTHTRKSLIPFLVIHRKKQTKTTQ